VGEALAVDVSVGSKVGSSVGTCVFVAAGAGTSALVADAAIGISTVVSAAGSSAGLHAANANKILNNNDLVCFILFLLKGSAKPHITLRRKIILSLLNSQCAFKISSTPKTPLLPTVSHNLFFFMLPNLPELPLNFTLFTPKNYKIYQKIACYPAYNRYNTTEFAIHKSKFAIYK